MVVILIRPAVTRSNMQLTKLVLLFPHGLLCNVGTCLAKTCQAETEVWKTLS